MDKQQQIPNFTPDSNTKTFKSVSGFFYFLMFIFLNYFLVEVYPEVLNFKNISANHSTINIISARKKSSPAISLIKKTTTNKKLDGFLNESKKV